ncbi:MAG: hypothetical protein J1D77_01350 [Muribaculaceae bacterium]|nr:hypothetical protein [Muribaculaceae bacterium]
MKKNRDIKKIKEGSLLQASFPVYALFPTFNRDPHLNDCFLIGIDSLSVDLCNPAKNKLIKLTISKSINRHKNTSFLPLVTGNFGITEKVKPKTRRRIPGLGLKKRGKFEVFSYLSSIC